MTKKAGTRHSLLFYRRTMDRVFSSSSFVAIVLLVLLAWSELQPPGPLGEKNVVWLTAGFLVTLLISLFAFISRWMAYTQAHNDHLRIVTPFLNLKISYRRIRRIHPTLVQQVFSKESARWAETSFLEPFYGKTALIIEVNSYPMSPMLLRFFLPRFIFSPLSSGFVLLVPDWMKFSTEIDSLYGNWLQNQKKKHRS